VRHTPAQPAALNSFFPTRWNDAGFTIISGGQSTHIVRPDARVRPLPAGSAYTTAAKVFNGIANTTGVADISIPIVNQSVVNAESKVAFSSRVIRGRTEQYINTRGTNAWVSPAFRALPVVNGLAGNLIRDPMEFENVPSGSVVSGIFDLDPTDFRVS